MLLVADGKFVFWLGSKPNEKSGARVLLETWAGGKLAVCWKDEVRGKLEVWAGKEALLAVEVKKVFDGKLGS